MNQNVNEIDELMEEKRNLVKKIVVAEWDVFDKIQSLDGRADCQDDYVTFEIMRSSQFLVWNPELLRSYMIDFETALFANADLVTRKYAYMMESTDPDHFKTIVDTLPKVPKEQSELIEKIVAKQLSLMTELQKAYPHFVESGRSLTTSEDNLTNTSYETYLRGELSSYSMHTVELYHKMLEEHEKNGLNTAVLYMESVAHQYGYPDIKSAEDVLKNS